MIIHYKKEGIPSFLFIFTIKPSIHILFTVFMLKYLIGEEINEVFMKTQYKRVLLKVSGEAISKNGTGIDPEGLANVASEVKELQAMGVEVGIVCGGGNFWRGRSSEKMDRALADQIGMLATCMNGLALKDAFGQAGIKTELMAAFEISQMCKEYNTEAARKALSDGKVVIFTGGTGHPFFSTDTGAALRAIEIQADVILLAKNVDAVYDKDPGKNPDAKKYSKITHTEVLEKDLKVMDSTAASLCRDNGMKIHVFGLKEPNAIIRACQGEEIGTLVY